MYARLENYFNLALRSNDMQLRRQLYTLRWQEKKSLNSFTNEIRLIANKINVIMTKIGDPLVTEHEMIAVLDRMGTW